MPERAGQDVLAFSLTTAPDVDGARLLYALDGLDDEDTARAMQQMALPERTGDALPAHLRKIKTGAVAGQIAGRFCVQTLDASQGEAGIIADLARRMADPDTRLISYGGNRDVPVLRCRALLAGVKLPECAHHDLAQLLTAGAIQAPPLRELLQLQSLPCVSQSEEVPCEIQAVQSYIFYASYLLAQDDLSETAFANLVREIRACLEDAAPDQAGLFAPLLQRWPAQ